MQSKSKAPWVLRVIIVFYAVGVVAVTITLFTNRVATGKQLALVHGLPTLAGVPAILLTIAMGVLVIVGLSSMRPWGYWSTMAYMGFLLLVPPLTMGGGRVSVAANIVWPLFVVIYLFVKRRLFGVGVSAERPVDTSPDGQKVV
jgi:hypothetical protein